MGSLRSFAVSAAQDDNYGAEVSVSVALIDVVSDGADCHPEAGEARRRISVFAVPAGILGFNPGW